MEERTLSAAHKFYCGKYSENVQQSGYHSDLRNIKAQLDRYPELENDMKSLSEFTTRKKIADCRNDRFWRMDLERKTQRGKSG
jgi:DNA polymerase-3 subunit epsilon